MSEFHVAAACLLLALRWGPDWPQLPALWRLGWLAGLAAVAGVAYLGTAFLLGLRPRHLLERRAS